MFGPLGLPEILFILVLALLVFGPRRLPQIGHQIGRALGEFRRATNELKRSIDTEVTLEEVRKGPEPAAPAPAAPAPTAPAPTAPAPTAGAAAAAEAAPADGAPDATPEGEAAD